MPDSTKDIVLGSAMFLIALGALLYIQLGPGVALQTSQDAQFTFRSFPTAIAALLMLLSGLFVSASLIQKGKAQPSDTGRRGRHAPAYLPARMASLLILLIAYAMLLGEAPFILLTSIFLFLAFLIFGQTNVLRSVVVAAIGGAFFHGLFITLLKLPLY